MGVRNRRGASRAKMLQKQKMLALHLLTHRFGERKELEVGHCVSGLQKIESTRVGEKEKLRERERVSGGLKCAATNLK